MAAVAAVDCMDPAAAVAAAADRMDLVVAEHMDLEVLLVVAAAAAADHKGLELAAVAAAVVGHKGLVEWGQVAVVVAELHMGQLAVVAAAAEVAAASRLQQQLAAVAAETVGLDLERFVHLVVALVAEYFVVEQPFVCLDQCKPVVVAFANWGQWYLKAQIRYRISIEIANS